MLFAAVFIVIVAAGGTSAASSDSIPGDRLYWVKTTREIVTLVMPRSDMDRAQIHARLATRRGEEIHKLLQRQRFVEAELMMQRFQYHLNQSATNVGFVLPPNPIEMPIRPLEVKSKQNALVLRELLERDGTEIRNLMAALVQDANFGDNDGYF